MGVELPAHSSLERHQPRTADKYRRLLQNSDSISGFSTANGALGCWQRLTLRSRRLAELGFGIVCGWFAPTSSTSREGTLTRRRVLRACRISQVVAILPLSDSDLVTLG
jgi:hypothetical protein